MIEFILSRVRGLGDETIIITNEQGNFKHMAYPIFPDVVLNWGALGGTV